MTLDDRNSLVLETKLSFPQPSGRDILERQRLLDLLPDNRDKKLILLTSCAGYGKSTLMSQWNSALIQRGVNTAWLTLDEDDNDPGRLFTYLRYALEGIKPQSVQLNDLMTVTMSHAALLANTFKSATAPSVLFIDELEALHNKESLRLLSLLQQHIPQGRQLVIASREKPDWNLSKLKLSDELLEIGVQELRFNTKDATLLGELRLTSPINENTTDKLIEKTEGWIAGIRLAILCFPSIDDTQEWVENITGELDEITDFLSEEVFRNLGTEQQLFLLKVAVLNRISAPLCEALTGESGAQTQLESFCEKGLFIHPLDKQRHWFKLHGLVREFLLKRLKQLIPQKITKLHESAARWHNSHGYKLEAIHHAISANNPLFASQILEDFSKYLVTQGQLRTVTSLAARISELQPIDNPALLSSMCWANLFLHQQEQAEKLFLRLKNVNDGKGLSVELQSQLPTFESLLLIMKDNTLSAGEVAERKLSSINEKAHFERGVLCNIIALGKLGFNEYDLAQQYQLKARTSFLKSGSCFGLAYSDMLGALREKLQGNLLVARERFKNIGLEQDYMQFDNHALSLQVAKAVCNGFEAGLLYELNLIEEAQQLLEAHFADAVNNTIPPDMVITGSLTRARIAFTKGEFESAYTYLEDAEVDGLSWRLPRLVREMRWERVRFSLLRGELESAKKFAAQTIINDIPVTPSGFFNPADECGSFDIAPLRFEIYTGNPASAIIRIEQLITESSERPCRKLILMVLKVLAYTLLEQTSNARQGMIDAIDLGCKIGAKRSIIDEGSHIIELLKQLCDDWGNHPNIANSKRTAYCKILLEAAGETLIQASEQHAPHEQISDRELEVLHLVRDGLKNDQIAKLLFVSVNTVKWHLRRLYEKLGVKSRTEAVAESRKLGLID